VPSKQAERESILGKVGRHPVENHADAGGVQRVDQKAQVVRVP
jgi:hypothetical protein